MNVWGFAAGLPPGPFNMLTLLTLAWCYFCTRESPAAASFQTIRECDASLPGSPFCRHAFLAYWRHLQFCSRVLPNISTGWTISHHVVSCLQTPLLSDLLASPLTFLLKYHEAAQCLRFGESGEFNTHFLFEYKSVLGAHYDL